MHPVSFPPDCFLLEIEDSEENGRVVFSLLSSTAVFGFITRSFYCVDSWTLSSDLCADSGDFLKGLLLKLARK